MKLRYLFLAAVLGALPLSSAHAFVDVSVAVAPPPLQVYAQPPCPVEGDLWTPGYWAYDNVSGYYWVPGVWVAPPQIGFLWTPGYWGFGNGLYAFHQGYWGPTVGFYGGINYGYGYGGNGYYGGHWENRVFRYNTAVTRVNTAVIHNTYVDRTVLNRQATASRTSFNGPGGITAHPTARQLAAARGPHVAPTGPQVAMRSTALRTAPAHNVTPAAPHTAVRTAPQTAARTAPQTAARTASQTAARTAPQTAARTAPQTANRTAPVSPVRSERAVNSQPFNRAATSNTAPLQRSATTAPHPLVRQGPTVENRGPAAVREARPQPAPRQAPEKSAKGEEKP